MAELLSVEGHQPDGQSNSAVSNHLMTPESNCPHCGTPLADTESCPRCELQLALEATLPLAQETDIQAVAKRFGDYELLEEIGHGGMGVVYLARHTKLNRLVALKLLLLGQFSSEQAVKRFQREAQAAAALRHPNIVGLHEVGEVEGQHYFTMELVEGRNLASLLRDGPLPPRLAAEYGHALAQGVSAAHAAGIIHRDLKPANILIDLFNQPRITDFGLAKRIDGSGDMTLTGHLLGSPNYLAPELAAGQEQACGPGTDIFSLGAILYECLTGRPPFLGSTMQETLLRVRDAEPVSPRVLNPKLPRDLETICLKCLEKEPAKRYATAKDLGDELNRFLNDEPIQARPATPLERGWRWCRRKPALAGAYGIVLVLLLALGLGGPIAAYRINQERKIAQSEAQRAQSEADRANVMESEARRSEYAADMLLAQKFLTENNRGATVKLLDKHRPGHGVPALAGGALEQQSSAILEVAPNRLKPGLRTNQTDLRGWEWHYLDTATHSQEIAVLRDHDTQVNDVAFSPDGRWLASGGLDASLRVWDARSHTLARTLSVGSGEIFSLAFSPDGRLLVAGADTHHTVTCWDTTNWQSSFVLTNQYRVNALAFSPDGQWLAAAGHNGGNGLVVWDLARRAPVAHWPLPNDVISVPLALAFSPDSRLLLYDLAKGQLGRWDTRTRQPLPPLEVSTNAFSLQRVVFAEDGTFAATSTGGGGVVRVWSLPAWQPKYQLTNEFLLTVSAREDLLLTTANQEVHYWRLRTGASLGSLAGHVESLIAAAISPADKIVATASYDNTVRLWPLQPVAPRRLVALQPTNETQVDWWQRPSISRDGRHILTIHTNGSFTIWDANTLERIAERPWPVTVLQSADISTDGKFVAAGGLKGELAILEVATGRIVAQTNLSTYQLQLLRYSPDGTRLAAHCNSLGRGSDPLEVLETQGLSRVQALGNGTTPMSAEFSANSRFLVTGYYSGGAEIVDLAKGQVIATLRGHRGRVTKVALTPDARLVATCGSDGTVRAWDGQTGRELRQFRGAWESYNSVALTPDGSRLAAGAEGVDIWDLASGRQVQTLRTPNEWMLSLAWTPDLSQLTTVSGSALRVWPSDTATLATTNVLPATRPVDSDQERAALLIELTAGGPGLIPLLDQLVNGDMSGFWRKARATARLWKGDLKGATEDNPSLAVPARDATCTERQVDFSPYYNLSLSEDGMGGLGVGLSELPIGFHSLAGIPFDLRGVVQLAGTCPNCSTFPPAATGVSLNQHCHRLHMLQATCYDDKDGTAVGHYVLHYEDGGIRELPITYGVDLRNWWTVPDEPEKTPNAEIAWRGHCRSADAAGKALRLWKRT